jgi:hypothetical protein
MISNLDDLRKVAVKHILRQGLADYLLRHSLCRPWVASTHLDEMAWTDFKSLFFNFPKLRAQLDNWSIRSVLSEKLDPGEETIAFLAAACHEILHVLWLHKYRGKDKSLHEWRAACEYAINFELVKVFGKSWIDHLGVMYPSNKLLAVLESAGIAPTTDGFYQVLLENSNLITAVPGTGTCHFCDRARQVDEEEECDPMDMVRVLHQLPPDAEEREDILKFLTAQQTPAQKVPWEMLLLGGIEDAITQEQSWARPSRRNDLLPGWRHEKLLSFVWILDVSPSISDEMKQSFMNTLQAGINLYHDAQHRVIFFADSIEADIVVSSGTNLSHMEIPSGCGTDLTDVWKILEQDLPEYALVLTDLELGPVPKPSYTKVVWGIVGDYRCFDPDYGVKIVLK